MKYLIVPDVHGRDFWKKPVQFYLNDKDTQIIFLGDYLDTYDFEHITDEHAVNNLKDIINLARNNSGKITLLLGNHDLHYFPEFLRSWGCRRINYRKEEISEIFMNNLDIFNVCHTVEDNGKKYLFTHAGVLKGWWAYVTGKTASELDMRHIGETYSEYMDFDKETAAKFNMTFTSENLNSLIKFKEGRIALNIISWHRGGIFDFGSCMWADIHERFNEDDKINIPEIDEYFQIFGHTLSFPSTDEFFIGDTYAMLDCRHCILFENNNFTKIYDYMITKNISTHTVNDPDKPVILKNILNEN